MGLSIPIYINVYNSFHLLVRMVQALTRKGYHRIVILDNNSSYPSLLGYYRRLPTRVRLVRLKTNMGHLAMWKLGLHHQHKNEWFALTDPDLNLAPLPSDFVAHLIALHGLTALGPAVRYPVPNARTVQSQNPVWLGCAAHDTAIVLAVLRSGEDRARAAA
jgi:GT2 family glycosyltransferase